MRLLGLIGFSLLTGWIFPVGLSAQELPVVQMDTTCVQRDLSDVIRSRSARGYTQGRYRGNNMVYDEAEYRFPISSCGGVLGGVLFVNATTANNVIQDLKLFETVRPGYGLGLRVMIDKQSRTNLAIDIGM